MEMGEKRERDELAPEKRHRDNLAVGAKVSKTKKETALAAQQSYQQFTAYDSPPPAARAIIARLKQRESQA